MKQPKTLAALLIVLSLLAMRPVPGDSPPAKAARSSDPKGASAQSSKSAAPKRSARPTEAIAVVQDRPVEEADIQRAAAVLADDPLRTRKHAAWRKKLLDLCVDRELLALEAERQGFQNDRVVKRKTERETARVLYEAIRDRYLIPESTPTQAQIDTARAGELYRHVKLQYILSLADRPTVAKMTAALKAGARFDSIAPLISIHPSAAKGGHVGWKRIKELNTAAWAEMKKAKPGEFLGPYSNSDAHEFFRVEEVREPNDKEIKDLMLFERSLGMKPRYDVGLFRKYNFAMNPDMVSPMVFAAATEKADSILITLDERGMREKSGIKPALGVLARVDGDSITYRDIGAPDFLLREPDGKGHIEDTRHLLSLCMGAFLPRLVIRDARARGIDKDPDVMRSVRLVQEEITTRAMVAKAVPEPEPSAVRAWFEGHASRYRLPPARRALVAMFVSEDSARMSLWAWTGPGFRDSTLAQYGLRPQPRANAASLLSGFYAEIPLYDTHKDALSAGVRNLGDGQVSPIIKTAHGYAIARMIRREEARPMTFEEASGTLGVEMREDLESKWVDNLLERLRAATPARRAPERLEAVRLGMNESGGKRR